MIRFSPIEEQQPPLQFALPQTSMLVLRITLKSGFVAPAIIQPRLNDWVTSKGEIIKANYNILPVYVFLPAAGSVSISVTIHIPPDLKENEIIRAALQFSSFKNCDIRLQVMIDNSVKAADLFMEHLVELKIPHSTGMNNETAKNELHNAEAVAKTIAGLSGLEIIPAKWLMAELLFALCEKGMNEATRTENKKIIHSLQQTKFFKNGVLVVSGSQLIHWVMMNMGISAGMRAVSGHEANSVLEQWKNILLSLSASDIELPVNGVAVHSFFQPYNYEAVSEKMGMEPDKWFLYLLLGLMSISPGLQSILQQISETAPGPKPEAKKKNKRTIKKVIHEKGSLQR